jgi:pSer/pThr/pTyr-binding forkhead associated (FHA) protein
VRQPAPRARVSSRAPTSGPRVSLIRQDGKPGAVYSLAGGNLVSGRASGEVPLPDDPSIAPRHAQFSTQNGRVSVEDLGSVSGTFLRLRAPLLLTPGDEIRIGRQLLRLEPFPKATQLASSSTTWGSPDRGYTLRLTQILDGGGVGEVYPLKSGENLVGRESGDITFPFDRYVSGRHARLDVQEGRATLSDLGSSNGTFYRISKSTVLQTGDQLLIGLQLIRFDA